MTVTIHQPNFLPWYPFFQKIQQADVFILLGHCQFEKGGYQNRFQLNGLWNTMSTNSGKHNIVDKSYINYQRDWSKIKTNLSNYRSILDELDYCISDNLYETNKTIIKHFLNKLQIHTKFVEDVPTELTSSERLLMLCKKVGATKYLAGQGGKDYLDETLFSREGIEVIYQDNINKIHVLDYLKNETTKF